MIFVPVSPLQAPLHAAFRFVVGALLALFASVCLGAALVPLTAPNWAQLSAQQKEVLKPLAGEWDSLDALRRKKWIVVADRYPKMKPEEKKRLQARMVDWARLSPEQRRVARENYKSAKAVPAEQKKAEWQQYQTLTEAQKQQLAAGADQKKPANQKAQRRQNESLAAKPVVPQKSRAAAPAAPVVPVAPAFTAAPMVRAEEPVSAPAAAPAPAAK